jgi:Single-strand binding protein family
MKGIQSPVEARYEAQAPEHGHHADQGVTAAQARRSYLQRAGGGLVAAFLGTVTRPSEFRARDGQPLLCFNAVPDGARQPDETAAVVLVEYGGDDQEALAAQLTKGAAVYCEGRLTLNTWIGRGGAERTGLSIKASHVEALGAHA